MKLFLDRIEGEYCVFVCNGITFDIPKALLDNVKEGDIYHLVKSDDHNTEKVNEKLVNKLFNR